MIHYLDYIHSLEDNNYIEWDVCTITSGDYTVEVDIGPDFYQDYVKQEQDAWIKTCLNFCICCKVC